MGAWLKAKWGEFVSSDYNGRYRSLHSFLHRWLFKD
jgi:hypothetical protein